MINADADQDEAPRWDLSMPKTDLECQRRGLGAHTPCPFARCRHNLRLEVYGMGFIRESRWKGKPGEQPPTCSLAEARKGDHSIGEVAALMGVIDNRVWQVEASGLAKVARALGMEGLTGLREIVKKLLNSPKKSVLG